MIEKFKLKHLPKDGSVIFNVNKVIGEITVMYDPVDVPEDLTKIVLTNEQFNKFVKELENPPIEHSRMKRLLNEKLKS